MSDAAAPDALATKPAPIKSRDPIDEPSRDVDWVSIIPQTAGEGLVTALEVFVFAVIIMNAWAVAHGCNVTTKIAIAGSVGGLLTTLAWKAFVAVAEAFGARVVGVAYAVVGAACCVAVMKYAASGESVTTSEQLRRVIQVLGLAFLYPAGLGAFAALKGDDVQAVNPLGFPLQPRWFSTLWILFAKEMRTFFTTAVPYIIILVSSALNGYLFFVLLYYYTRPGMGELARPGEILGSNGFTLVSSWFIWPAITMRLVAEEKRQGTIETLLTVPVTDAQVIISKFLAALAFFAVNLLPFLGYHFVMAQYARDWDWGPVFAEFLGLGLWASMGFAIGLFYSTLTDSQLVAFILSAFTNVVFWFIQVGEQFLSEDTAIWFIKLKSLTHYLAVHTHYSPFVKGQVSTDHIAYFASITCLALFASVRGLEAQRWK